MFVVPEQVYELAFRVPLTAIKHEPCLTTPIEAHPVEEPTSFGLVVPVDGGKNCVGTGTLSQTQLELQFKS